MFYTFIHFILVLAYNFIDLGFYNKPSPKNSIDSISYFERKLKTIFCYFNKRGVTVNINTS